jgi:hypothetical protein
MENCCIVFLDFSQFGIRMRISQHKADSSCSSPFTCRKKGEKDMKRTVLVFSFVFLAILLTGCGDTPEGAAREWFNAQLNLDGTKILERTCAAQVQNVQQAGLVTSAFALLPQLFGLDMNSKGDVSDIKFSTTSLNGDNATVHVSGKIRVAVLAFATDYPIDQIWNMAKEDNKWKWCGVP